MLAAQCNLLLPREHNVVRSISTPGVWAHQLEEASCIWNRRKDNLITHATDGDERWKLSESEEKATLIRLA